MKKINKIIAGAVAFILIGGLLWFANGLVGNPISKMIANKNAASYISEYYPDMDLEIGEASYSFKTGRYYVQVKSPTSIDTHFSLDISPLGKVVSDSYENAVLDKFNTWARINEEYRLAVDKIFSAEDFPYDSDIDYGELVAIYPEEETMGDKPFGAVYGLPIEELELDKIYDSKELGKTAGYLVFYGQDDVVTVQRAAEILLDIRKIFDEAHVPFYAIDFILEKPHTEDGQGNPDDTEFRVNQFLYSDIYEDGLVSRLDDAAKALEEYYEIEDAKKAEMEE